jgi:hypothetical protein
VKFDLEQIINISKLPHNYSDVCKYLISLFHNHDIKFLLLPCRYLQYERNLSSWDALLGADLETIKELIIDYQSSYETNTKPLDDFLNCIANII